jgi:hypothetical protein
MKENPRFTSRVSTILTNDDAMKLANELKANSSLTNSGDFLDSLTSELVADGANVNKTLVDQLAHTQALNEYTEAAVVSLSLKAKAAGGVTPEILESYSKLKKTVGSLLDVNKEAGSAGGRLLQGQGLVNETIETGGASIPEVAAKKANPKKPGDFVTTPEGQLLEEMERKELEFIVDHMDPENPTSIILLKKATEAVNKRMPRVQGTLMFLNDLYKELTYNYLLTSAKTASNIVWGNTFSSLYETGTQVIGAGAKVPGSLARGQGIGDAGVRTLLVMEGKLNGHAKAFGEMLSRNVTDFRNTAQELQQLNFKKAGQGIVDKVAGESKPSVSTSLQQQKGQIDRPKSAISPEALETYFGFKPSKHPHLTAALRSAAGYLNWFPNNVIGPVDDFFTAASQRGETLGTLYDYAREIKGLDSGKATMWAKDNVDNVLEDLVFFRKDKQGITPKGPLNVEELENINVRVERIARNEGLAQPAIQTPTMQDNMALIQGTTKLDKFLDNPLAYSTYGAMKGINSIPIIGPTVAPFTNTAVNAANKLAESLPTGMLSGNFRRELAGEFGKSAQDRAHGKLITGVVITYGALNLAGNSDFFLKNFYGNGDGTNTAKDLQGNNNLYTVTVTGDDGRTTVVDLRQTHPAVGAFMVVGRLSHLLKENADDNPQIQELQEQWFPNIIAMSVDALGTSKMNSQMSQLFRIVTSGEEASTEKAINQILINSATPVVGAIGGARNFDLTKQYYDDTRLEGSPLTSMIEKVRNMYPVIGDLVDPEGMMKPSASFDMFGTKKNNRTYLGSALGIINTLTPVGIGKSKGDLVEQFVLDNAKKGIFIPKNSSVKSLTINNDERFPGFVSPSLSTGPVDLRDFKNKEGKTLWELYNERLEKNPLSNNLNTLGENISGSNVRGYMNNWLKRAKELDVTPTNLKRFQVGSRTEKFKNATAENFQADLLAQTQFVLNTLPNDNPEEFKGFVDINGKNVYEYSLSRQKIQYQQNPASQLDSIEEGE